MKARPYVLTIAGFDPSGGAGVLADSKTFEAFKTIGLGVSTAITYQTEDFFEGVDWQKPEQISKQLSILLKRYPIKWVKIGLVQNMQMLKELVLTLKEANPAVKIIWDPILKASAGHQFHGSIMQQELEDLANNIFMITPNFEEMEKLYPECTAMKGAEHLSHFCKVYLKGGHNKNAMGRDYLFINKQVKHFKPGSISSYEKHGSGCVLSSAILAGLAKGYPLTKACLKAKTYVTRFLSSNSTLLGYHKI